MFRKFKKIIAGIFIGLGIGILLILYLPLNAWLVLISISLILVRHQILIQMLGVNIYDNSCKKSP